MKTNKTNMFKEYDFSYGLMSYVCKYEFNF